jgi:hypothetical protein
MNSTARTLSPDTIYASEIGVSRKRIRMLGGSEKLRGLSPEARAVLLGPHKTGLSRTVHAGGITARGFVSRVRGIDSQKAKVA